MPECPICLGNVEDPCVAPCNHVYCCQCIVQVLVSTPPEWAGSCPLCRTHISVYNLQNNGQPLIEPDVQSLWGCIFIQHGKLGLASYHFNSLEDCYISYDAAPPTWRLDDGSAPPSRKAWQEVEYDQSTRTFRGVIEWDPAFKGSNKWIYRIEFSEDFAGIVGGEVVWHFTNSEQTRTSPFLAPWIYDWEHHLSYIRWTPPPSTIFGSVFVQGISYSSVLEGVASYHFESPENCYISYANAPDSWLLDNGSKPPRQKAFEQISYDQIARTFKGTVQWPEGFDGAVRWDYTIVFAEDLGHICAGKVQPYGALGLPQPAHHYGDPTSLRVSASVMHYVRKPSALSASAQLQQRLLARNENLNQSAMDQDDQQQLEGTASPDLVCPVAPRGCQMQ